MGYAQNNNYKEGLPMGNTATLKRPQGININPSEEELDIDKMEATITLDDSTKEKILSKHRKRIAKKELGNAELKARIEKKDLEQKLEAATVGTLSNAVNEQKKTILRLLQASLIATIIFIFLLPMVLSFLHGYSIASLAERLGGKFGIAYIFGLMFSGIFESLMIGMVLQYNDKGARLTMYAAMIVLALVTSIEVFKRGLDVLQITDLTRLIGGIALLPIVKVFTAKIRDKAEGKGKKNFDRLSEEVRNAILEDCKKLQKELKKYQAIPTKTETRFNPKTGKTNTFTRKEGVYKIDRFNFREYSNAKQIYEHSLKKILVDNGIYTNTLWKQLPSKKGKGKTDLEMNEFLQTTESKNPKKLAAYLKKNIGLGASLSHVASELKKAGYGNIVDSVTKEKGNLASVDNFINLLNGKKD